MGATLFLLLFFLGLLLSTIGNIIGIVDAFRFNVTWGILALLVPFALLIYCIKFWNRKWARNGLLMGLGGMAVSLLSLPLAIGSLARLAARQVEQEFEQGSIVVEGDPVEGETPAEGEVSVEGATPTPTEGGEELFQESFLPGLPSAAQIALAELLPSTDANERLKEINVNRPDPFSIVQIPVPPKPAPPAPTTRPGAGAPGGTAPGTGGGLPQVPGGTSPGGAGNGTTNPGGSANPGGTPPGATQPTPEAPGTIKPLPELPNPVATASQVQITGVAKVNGDNYAIVRAPGDTTSRYVKAGDRIANGSVLVKRIDAAPGKDPVVVLEERGVEVALPVGSNVGPSEGTTEEQTAMGATAGIAAIPFLP